MKDFIAFKYDPDETQFTDSQIWLIKKAAVQMAAILSGNTVKVPYPFNFTPNCKWNIYYDREQRVKTININYTIKLDYDVEEREEVDAQMQREYDAKIEAEEQASLSNPDGPGSWDRDDYIDSISVD